MSSALNVTKAAFGGLREVATSPLWQYDYGQILEITGLDLPQAFEVHFSNSRKSGETITQIGTNGAVTIPDMYLTSGADIYAFVFLHDGLTDGETEYVIKIPVRERPEPSDIEPTPEQQDAITEAIAALNVAVEQSETNVEHYPCIIDGYWHVWDAQTEAFVSTGVEAQGNGIASAVLNADYTLTLTFTDGTTYTTPSIRGETGASGVYVGDTEPTDPNQNVWVDPSGTDDFQTIVDMVLAEVPTVTVDSALDNTSPNPVQNKVITQKIATIETVVETVTGTDPVITAEANHRYICGELATLDFTPCESGICDIVFVSGSTATVLTLPVTVKMPDDFAVEADKTYEINIMDGIYGAVMAWT